MCELMFPKPTRKKKRKHHPAPIVDTVKGECFLCRMEGIRRQQYTEEHHVFYGGGLRQVSEENRKIKTLVHNGTDKPMPGMLLILRMVGYV